MLSVDLPQHTLQCQILVVLQVLSTHREVYHHAIDVCLWYCMCEYGTPSGVLSGLLESYWGVHFAPIIFSWVFAVTAATGAHGYGLKKHLRILLYLLRR